MALAFPNPSRSYDEARKAIRFAGHDGMFEVSFFVEIKALGKSIPDLSVRSALEAACLSAFDASRPAIQKVAQRAYTRGHREIYTLTAADFR